MKIKPGVKTSEFWISLMVPVVVVIFNEALGWSVAPEMIMTMFGITGSAYTISRGIAKKS